MKNIMFIIPSLSNGGAERAILNLANALSINNNCILVVADNKKSYECNLKIIEIKELNKKLTKLFGIIKLRKLKKLYKIDTSISFLTSYNFVNVTSKYNDKIIISIRNFLSQKKEGFIPKIMHKYSLKKADKIVCVSNDVLNDQIKNYNIDLSKTTTIYNFIDKEKIDVEKEKTISKLYKEIFNHEVIITLGRNNEQKAQWHLIKSFKKVIEKCDDARLVIIGNGHLKDYLKDLVIKLNLEKYVHILDFDPNPYKYLNNSKIFVLSSLYEGMPNVVLEAMYCNLPVIATNSYGGLKEILKEKETEYGIIVPNCDGNKDNLEITKEEIYIADSIIKLLKDKKLYEEYKKLSKVRVQEFTKDKIIKEWEEII